MVNIWCRVWLDLGRRQEYSYVFLLSFFQHFEAPEYLIKKAISGFRINYLSVNTHSHLSNLYHILRIFPIHLLRTDYYICKQEMKASEGFFSDDPHSIKFLTHA